MARAIKDNADYFTHDADMRDDPKIKALRRKYKAEGYGIWCMLLEVITDSDNFRLCFDPEIIAGDFDVDPDLLVSIVQYCVQMGLLCTDEGCKTVWSKTMDKRFESLLSKRERDRLRLSSAKTTKSDIIASESTQSRVEKSRVEESKEYITIDSQKVFDVLPILQFYEAALNARQSENQTRAWKDVVPEWFKQNLLMAFNDQKHVLNSFSRYLLNEKPNKQSSLPVHL